MPMINVKVQMLDSKLGLFLTKVLPTHAPWARMIGYDLLHDPDSAGDGAANGSVPAAKRWKAKFNPNFRPTRNTAGDVILKLLAKTPATPVEVFAAYKGEKFNRAALNSGLYNMRDHGLIKQRDDGKYELAVAYMKQPSAKTSAPKRDKAAQADK